ncbi:MAG: type I-D CRISPR-associated protein Cas5/Csc1 [Candidatus Asgardarchaeia archaeon]
MPIQRTFNFLYDCKLITLDFIHFSSLEVARRVVIQPVIHNYALSYALFLKDRLPVLILGKKEIAKPKYKEDLMQLNEERIYVTPAYDISAKVVSYVWGAKEERLLHKERQVTANYPPSMVIYESIAPNSTFRFFILSEKQLSLPRIIRLGKKRGSVAIEFNEFELSTITPERPYTVKLLNPWDLRGDVEILELSSIINIPPNRLFRDVIVISKTAYYSKDLKIILPHFEYYAREEVS